MHRVVRRFRRLGDDRSLTEHNLQFFAGNVSHAVPRIALVVEDVLAVGVFKNKPRYAVSEFDVGDC